jgi:hypothetical protein
LYHYDDYKKFPQSKYRYDDDYYDEQSETYGNKWDKYPRYEKSYEMAEDELPVTKKYEPRIEIKKEPSQEPE